MLRVITAILLGLCSTAQAQQLISDPLPLTIAPRITLSVTIDQAQMVVETLGQIGCQNVQQMMTCQRAAELLRDIQRQVREQQK